MTDTGESRAAHEDLVDRIRVALSTVPARSRVTMSSPPRDERGRFAAAPPAEEVACGD